MNPKVIVQTSYYLVIYTLKLKGQDGESYTDGCLKLTCNSDVWRPSIDETVCCYDREPYSLNSIIISTTSRDGCIVSTIECRLEENRASMFFQVDNRCGELATKKRVYELKQNLEEHFVNSGNIKSFQGTVGFVNLMIFKEKNRININLLFLKYLFQVANIAL